MDILKSVTKNGKDLVTVHAYRGDAMTLLCMDLDKSMIENFTGFSIAYTPPGTGMKRYYVFNRFSFDDTVIQKSKIDTTGWNAITSDNAPIQKFRWVHTPSNNHNINDWIFGAYLYEITPRYLVNDTLQPIDNSFTVKLTIDITPYQSGDLQIGFTRGFIESQAYSRHFGMNNKIRPNKKDLIFNITDNSGPSAKDKKANKDLVDYDFKAQHTWLDWQARQIITDLLAETIANKDLTLDVFAFDLDEPVVCDSLIKLAKEGRVRVILDNSADHTKTGKLEVAFDKLYKQEAKDKTSLVRGDFLNALAHSKVFIQKLKGKPVKVLAGSTNFSTNGLYINANHVLVFKNDKIAALYEKVFTDSFSQDLMNAFRGTAEATTDSVFTEANLPAMTIRFSPHTKAAAQIFFDLINKRILAAKTDILFAVMKDTNKGGILDALMKQIESDKVFTYGVTDVIGDKTKIYLYKPKSKKGIRVAGKPGQYILPPPFEAESDIPGISIHHKFIVVDFKGANPVVYCGSSNLAFTPEQHNGDNLIEIRDRDAVTVFAIEAIRLTDHFEFRDAEYKAQQTAKGKKDAKKTIKLHNTAEKDWIKAYYDKDDLKCAERELLVG